MATTTSVHSRAFNFSSYVEGGVDKRTAQYTVNVALPEVKTNNLQGPGFPLALKFSPLSPVDMGFGLGWNLNLSEFDIRDKIISLHTGERFKVTGTGSNNELQMDEKKLNSFRLYEPAPNRYRVVHKNGLIEILEAQGASGNQVALPVEIYSPQGHKVRLTYTMFGEYPRLEQVIDDTDQVLLKIDRSSDQVVLRLHPNAPGGPLAQIDMTLSTADKWVSAIILPTAERASWRFAYKPIREFAVITQVETPMGAVEQIFYDDEGHQFPVKSGRLALPRVTRHLTTPGHGQADVDVRFTFPNINNFLGGGLNIDWEGTGQDNLYSYLADYVYSVEEHLFENDAPVRTVVRDFNRLHLLISEKTVQGDKAHTVLNTYDLLPTRPINEQAPHCQLPLTTIQRWSLSDSTRPRSETTTYKYDSEGNPTREEKPNGVIETREWYPKSASDGCPEDPHGFIRHLKSLTVTPATSGETGAPTLKTEYRYKAVPPVNGSGQFDWIAEERQILSAGTKELKRTELSYIEKPAEPDVHGRISEQKVTLNNNPTKMFYAYSRVDSQDGHPLLETVLTVEGFDGKTKVMTTRDVIRTGHPKIEYDDNDVQIEYEYDFLGRVTKETVAPGTAYEAFRTFAYTLCAGAGEQATQTVVDVNEVPTVSRFDGLARVVEELRDDKDPGARNGTLRPIYSAVYNALGQLVKETVKDIGDEFSEQLTTEFLYDEWGEQRCAIGPDGVKSFEETDPLGSTDHRAPIKTSWQESSDGRVRSGKTVTRLDLFGEEVLVERYDVAETKISRTQSRRDGLGRLSQSLEGVNTATAYVTRYGYDEFDREVSKTLPDLAVVRREYADHSDKDLPTKISVNNKELGCQTFNGLDLRTSAKTGGREERFEYEQGLSQPSIVTKPDGSIVGYDYTPRLHQEPVERRKPNSKATYAYDSKNARLLTCVEDGVALELTYYSNGERKTEKRTQGGDEYTMAYRYSLLGKPLGYTDVLGQTQRHEYDAAGRLSKTVLGTTTTGITYDSLGLTDTVTTHDSGQQLVTRLKHDEFGREIERQFDFGGSIQTMTQTYDHGDRLLTRTLVEGGTVLRDETYGYDNRDRLVSYTCEGSEKPIDPYGQAIKEQVFRFDELDNITTVITVFENGGQEVQNRARYFFENLKDPAQLTRVTNNQVDYGYPAEIRLTYDLNGNLTTDEAGRTLEYDNLNRLMTVREPGRAAPSVYRYDAQDKLAANDDEQRFYNNDQLFSVVSDGKQSTFMRADVHLVAEQQSVPATRPADELSQLREMFEQLKKLVEEFGKRLRELEKLFTR
ncbi:RHS repeat domain-containing protein [Pseudomonas sp. R5(2019)]|uniref:RHS repeat domain-containing protein n=1 Tax=Pseudomonas sp. R5(2019) TaxID=2697566 RepID=UPI001411C1FF|nr:RHS repeat protein [Pseudomonas sp. R5(2019)]NBA97403.1 sugar-binding protein [Pseudomonas sp. R5(2019)]